MVRFFVGFLFLTHTASWAMGELFMRGEFAETDTHIQSIVQSQTRVESGTQCTWTAGQPILLARFGEFDGKTAEGWARYIADYPVFKQPPVIDVLPQAKWQSLHGGARFAASFPVNWLDLAKEFKDDPNKPNLTPMGALVMPPVHVQGTCSLPGCIPFFNNYAADPFLLHLSLVEFVYVENRGTKDSKETVLFDISWN